MTCASGTGPKRRAEMLDIGIIDNGAIAINSGTVISVGVSNDILREFQSDNMRMRIDKSRTDNAALGVYHIVKIGRAHV